MRTEEEIRKRIAALKKRESLLVGGADWETRRARKTTREAHENEREVLEWVLEKQESE